ncbi:transposase [Dysgonomonas sp.]
MVVIRQRIKERPQATGKQLKLFKDDAYYRQYRYTAYFTNVKLPATEVWRLYRARADAENQIKELKYDFGFDSFNLNDFYATEAALIFAMIAYNLMAIFRLFIIKSEVQNRLSTLRFKTFAIGAYFENVDGRVILRLALHPQRRRWFETLWNRANQFKTPAIFSNA